MSQGSKARPIIMAASTAALAVTGAWYGAGLKEKQEIKQVLLLPFCARQPFSGFRPGSAGDLSNWLICAVQIRKQQDEQKSRPRTRSRSWSRREQHSWPKELGWRTRLRSWKPGSLARRIERASRVARGDNSEVEWSETSRETSPRTWFSPRNREESCARVYTGFVSL